MDFNERLFDHGGMIEITLSVKKKNGEKWPNFVLGDQILTGLKF